MEDVKLLESHLRELNDKKFQFMTIRDRIEVESWKGTKRQLSIGITNLETAILFFQEAISEAKREYPERYA